MLVQPLEPRVFLAATLSNGTAKVTATDGDDGIVLRAFGTTMSASFKLTINGQRQPVDFLIGRVGDVPRDIVIDARGGDDWVHVRYVGYAKPIIVKGGRGDDSIELVGVGGVARGGPGDDAIYAESPDPQRPDSLYGDGGDDTLEAAGADSFLSGGAGNDLLIGGWGDDIIKGGSGTDRFFGGSGDDTLYVSKKEKYDPGKGNDEIVR